MTLINILKKGRGSQEAGSRGRGRGLLQSQASARAEAFLAKIKRASRGHGNSGTTTPFGSQQCSPQLGGHLHLQQQMQGGVGVERGAIASQQNSKITTNTRGGNWTNI